MNSSKRLFMDVHVIQTLPPSNINRDDTGSPKTAQYGGVKRARVSSQSWKRAMRLYFNEFGAANEVGVRTKDIVAYVAEKIREIDAGKESDEAMTLAETVINKAGISTKDHKAKALFFMGNQQAKNLAQAALDGQADKKTLQKIMNDNPNIDIALFGRMVADDPSLNEDASAQVAHAVSTHAVQTEFDYYTAMDDLSPEDQAGAGMLGNIEYNSSTLYRYANVAVHALNRQVKGKEETIDALKLFVKAFCNSLPTGKINTFANQTLAQMLVVVLRTDRPVNLVTAFENPVRAKDGYVEESVDRFAEEFTKSQKFVDEPSAVYCLTTVPNEKLTALGENVDSISVLLQSLGDQLNTLMEGI